MVPQADPQILGPFKSSSVTEEAYDEKARL